MKTMMEEKIGPLRQALIDEGGSMASLTVLDVHNDPFRVDTPTGHRDGVWLATLIRDLGLGDRAVHLRGLHYMLLGRPKPNGEPYANTSKDWDWLQGNAGKAARWLGYVPFDQITDQRNTAPTVRPFTQPAPEPYVAVGVDVSIPDADDLDPYVGAYEFDGVQPYKLVLFGEKSSLADVLGPIATSYKADLYLATGEISDTLVYRMARVGADDGRPMVVLCFSDADPAGWQMPVSIARKLQAFKALSFADLEFLVIRAALTPDQVRSYRLPSTPLKETERRADRWREAMGIDQTEIDALGSLRPDLLREIARDTLDPFFDHDLDRRVAEAYTNWRDEAQAVLDGTLDAAQLAQIRADAADRLGELREQIDAINDALRIDVDDLALPPIVVPEADTDGREDGLLVDSGWSFGEQCRRLIESKAYRE
jgi:hypothetical protein